ncbi:S9 family peptidase [Hoylesella loescheii]|uniref:Peptidase, S9A/B/C family, catalytic domain protein n=1 Tax=Hoylesella loescheii DSM 19665 = JCM 12249 = ATCC 15930 TaxID=1122985 RepID=A0A069QKQ8_HOYLO|nr:DPP IV N-terminal domain-containing protein [Hoylesella loescheii]KDR53395.1 peptidase, S9A/B/C family, catalytic domain protein [Hoylesella loescheii DSM 19665 = JCM 12249 = ATCC 15930]
MTIKQIIVGAMLSTIIFAPQSMSAQKQFTLEDLNYGGNNFHNMVPKNRYTAWWGDQLVRTDAEFCALIDKNTGKETRLFSVDDINKWVASIGNIKVHSLYHATFPYPNQQLVLLNSSKMRMLVNWKTKQVVWKQDAKDENFADWNAQSRAVAFVKGDNLYVNNAQGTLKQLTKDGSRDIVYGQSVHRDEFGIYKGTFWSNDGQKLAFYRMDQSMVADYPLVDIDTRIATETPVRYPMAGEKSHLVTVGIYDLNTDKTVYLNTGDPTDRYFTNIAWAPDGKLIYLIEMNRAQNHYSLDAYDPATGNKTATLYTESSDKYVHPMHAITFLPWDKSRFILQSEKDGYNHLYLFDTSGKQIKQLTTGKWIVVDLLGFNAKTKEAIILSTEASPIQNNLYAVNLQTGTRRLLDNGKGCHANTTGEGGSHKPALSLSGQWILDSYTEPTVPRNIDIVNVASAKATRYFTAENPWVGYTVPEYTCGKIKAADGTTDLYYRMVKPTNFDPNKKYPTIIYVYGGPGVRNVEARWHYWSRGWETYMAQKGYLLFILDNRGSSARGLAFEQATFHHLGVEEAKDQMKGVEYLTSLPYVDKDRMGVHGWSFGGFMTTTLITSHPEVFKVGVAGGPVIDWKWYEVMYGERYMGTPQNNPKGYAESSLLSKAKNLKGKLQIITGMNDPVVVPQHCLNFLQECIKVGTQPDFFVYPGEPHNMRGHQSTHLHERISQYFDDYLK